MAVTWSTTGHCMEHLTPQHALRPLTGVSTVLSFVGEACESCLTCSTLTMAYYRRNVPACLNCSRMGVPLALHWAMRKSAYLTCLRWRGAHGGAIVLDRTGEYRADIAPEPGWRCPRRPGADWLPDAPRVVYEPSLPGVISQVSRKTTGPPHPYLL